ncbi:hypothetical protein ACOSQ3_004718 [Xanthoceras sorbifolium]
MNFIFEVHLRRTTNPLGLRSNPEGSKIEPRGFEDRTPLGSISNPEGFEDRTLLGSCLRTQKGSCLRTLLGSIFEPSGFHEPRRVRRSNPPGFRTLWVRGTQRVRSQTQKGSKIRTLLGSWNAEGSKRVRSRTHKGSKTRTQKGFDLRTLWVQSRTQRVRGSSKMNFEDEVHLRRTKMNFKKFFFFFFLGLHH